MGTGKTKNGCFDDIGDLYNLFIKEDIFKSPIYKITGYHRVSINKFIKFGYINPNSILGKLYLFEGKLHNKNKLIKLYVKIILRLMKLKQNIKIF